MDISGLVQLPFGATAFPHLPRRRRPARNVSVTDDKGTNMARLFLGLDSSTQSLSAILIDIDMRRIVYEPSLGFDKTLPHYGTRNGTLRSPDPLVVHSPPLMWTTSG